MGGVVKMEASSGSSGSYMPMITFTFQEVVDGVIKAHRFGLMLNFGTKSITGINFNDRNKDFAIKAQ